MFSRWVTGSNSPPDDVMNSNCNGVASGSRAEEGKKREGVRRKERKRTQTFFVFYLYLKSRFEKQWHICTLILHLNIAVNI